MNIPTPFEPVLAKIATLDCLGITSYYEVIFHDGERWRSYSGSDTFEDAEQVIKWKYVQEALKD